jgi:hypothetical protein
VLVRSLLHDSAVGRTFELFAEAGTAPAEGDWDGLFARWRLTLPARSTAPQTRTAFHRSGPSVSLHFGGRHYVALQTIAELLRQPSVDGIGELKRTWTYGFCVRCCEDAVRT